MPEAENHFPAEVSEHPNPSPEDTETYERIVSSIESASTSIHTRQGLEECRGSIGILLDRLKDTKGFWLTLSLVATLWREHQIMVSIRKSSFKEAQHMRQMRVTLVRSVFGVFATALLFLGVVIGSGLYVKLYDFKGAVATILTVIQLLAGGSVVSILSFYFSSPVTRWWRQQAKRKAPKKKPTPSNEKSDNSS